MSDNNQLKPSVLKLLKSKKHAEALDMCNQALKESPHSPETNFIMARVQTRLENFDKAAAYYNKAAKYQTDSKALCKYYWCLGEMLFDNKKFIKSIVYFTEALNTGYVYFKSSSFFYRADAYLSLEQYQKALDDLLCIEGDMLLYNSKGKREKSAMIAEARAGVARRNKKYDLTPKN